MRTLKQLPVPQDTDLVKFPQGTIVNETDIVVGTPVVRELYGDILTNIYKMLSLTGLSPTGTEDSETSQYQIVEALNKWANELNDKEQVLSLAGVVWSVPFNLDILPDKYVFIARASDSYNPAVSYTFKGINTNPNYALSSLGFDASDEVLVIIDQAGVRVISLTRIASSQSQTFNVFGQPLSFNSTGLMYYNTEGQLLNDTPSISDLRAKVRAVSTDALAEIYDMVILKGFVLCFTYLPGTTTYKFYHFDLNDLNTAINVPVTGIAIPVGSDNEPYMYTDGNDIYITNTAGTTGNDEDISKLSYTPATPTIAFISTISLNAAFQKTSNVVIQGTDLFTYVGSVLKKYSLLTGNETIIDDFLTIIGVIFNFNGAIYYTNGEVATKWTI